MTRFTIVGGGFGLYGYLPALIKAGKRVVLPEKYRSVMAVREELSLFIPSIQWEADREACYSRVDGVAIAFPPDIQKDIVRDCLSHGIKTFLLEKPLQTTPKAADELLDDLQKAQACFRVGYIFLYTSWIRQLKSRLAGLKSKNEEHTLFINWRFTAHHIKNVLSTWKADENHGGGIIKFYGIHLLAMLANFGYNEVHDPRTYGADLHRPVKWSARFTGAGLPEFNVLVDADAPAREFCIGVMQDGIKSILVDLAEPFERELVDLRQDLRVAPLSRIVEDLEFGDRLADTAFYSLCRATHALWKDVELKSKFYSDASQLYSQSD